MSFDDYKMDAPELDNDAPTDNMCPICGAGEDDADVCGPECEHILDIARAGRTVARLYAACRRAMRLAREYREEERWRGRKSRRLEAVMQQVALWRADVRFIRMAMTQKEAA